MKKNKKKKRKHYLKEWLGWQKWKEIIINLFDYDSLAGYVMAKIIFGSFCWGYFRVLYRHKIKIIGKENIPKYGKVVYYAKHQSMFDPGLVQIPHFPRCILNPALLPYIPAAQENFFPKNCQQTPILRKIPFVRDTKFFAWLMHHAHAIPVKEGRKDSRVLKKLIRLVDQGCNITIFPEGTRIASNNLLGNFRPGITTIINKAKPVKVVPIWINGAADILPKGQAKPDWSKGKITIIIGQSIKEKIDTVQYQYGYRQTKLSWLRQPFGRITINAGKSERTVMLELLHEELLKLKP